MRKIMFLALLVFTMMFIGAAGAYSHCDTMDGPVIKAAREALKTGNVNLVLIWVQKKDENEIKKLFEITLQDRKLSKESEESADMRFFEALVRIHRTGEGAPYSGIKPAGTEIEPSVKLTDKAIETGKNDELFKVLNAELKEKINEQYKKLLSLKKYDANNVDEGREFIESYVSFTHFIERIFLSIENGKTDHHIE